MKQKYDVVIVGGAVMGSALAYFLAKESNFNGSVLVIERDPTYQKCSTALSAGSIRQQFSTLENIRISQFGVQFLHDLHEELAIDNDHPDVFFHEDGYLLLASPEGAETLRRNHQTQASVHATVELLTPNNLSERFPWLNTEGVELGALGVQGEGWFDAYSLLQALRKKARHLGVTYLHAEVAHISQDKNQIESITLADGQQIQCGTLVNAAGPNGRKVAEMVGIKLPVESRKRYVYVFHCRESMANLPLVVDPCGLYFRPEGDHFICGISPDESEDPECFDFEVDYTPFDELIWPKLAERVPAFEAIKLTNAWAGHYAYNTFDQNAILGPHPTLKNFIFMNGFSGHGLQQAPAVGRGIAEWITYQNYQTLDLECFSFDRIAADKPTIEVNII